MTISAGHFYPNLHRGWGGCAEELFHYTSRYYFYTEAFIRNLLEDRDFSMQGYQATKLSPDQHTLMAAVLCTAPDITSASAVASIVDNAISGKKAVPENISQQFQAQLDTIPQGIQLAYKPHEPDFNTGDIPPIDPFLSMAERLLIPVAVREHHVEVSLTALAKHLDSPKPQVRRNLRDAILRLHHAGYLVRNHPALTHAEAHAIGDEDAV